MVQTTTKEWEARLGQQVRALRIAASLTQADLARLASLSETSVRAIERGSGSTLATLVAITGVLGRTEWLSEYDPRGTGPSPIELLRQSRRQPARPQRVRKART